MSVARELTSLPAQAKSGEGLGANGYHLNLVTEGRTDAGLVLIASTGAGNFFVSNTTGTSTKLLSEVATSNTKTDKVAFFTKIPDWYDNAGSKLTITVNANYTATGTAGTTTIAVAVYGILNGVQGAQLCSTPVQGLSLTASDWLFYVPAPTGLFAGQRILVEVTGIIQDTSGGNSQIAINGVKIG